MAGRLSLGRMIVSVLTALAVAAALLLVIGGQEARADHLDTWPWSEPTNHASFWVTWGATYEGESDWVCIKDDRGGDDPYVLVNPPAGMEWRLLVLKAGSEYNDLYWDPTAGTGYEHTDKGGWSHVILCSRPVDEETTTSSTLATTTSTSASSTTSVQQLTSTSSAGSTSTSTEQSTSTSVASSTSSSVSQTTVTSEQESTTSSVSETTVTTEESSTSSTDPATLNSEVTTSSIPDEVLATEVLPFTGLDSGGLALLAMALAAAGALVLVATRSVED